LTKKRFVGIDHFREYKFHENLMLCQVHPNTGASDVAFHARLATCE